MLLVQLIVFVIGVVLLVAGAESLVRGGSRLAASFRVSPLVIGLTVVSFGTSAPELVVSLVAALQGDPTLAVGNVVGSNIFNLLAILGPTALVLPVTVAAGVVRREIPIMLVAILAFVLLALDGTISRVEGLLFLAGLVAYLVTAYRSSRSESEDVQHEFEEEFGAPPVRRVAVDVLLVVLGLALLVGGGRLVVSSAVAIAEDLGVSERIIALTLVAAGTSLPELATSLVAAVRKHADIAVGNVVGSTLFNILAIVGSAAVVTPLVVLPAITRFDIPVMVLAGVLLLPLAWSGSRVNRVEGGLLLAGYLTYLGALVTGWGPAAG